MSPTDKQPKKSASPAPNRSAFSLVELIIVIVIIGIIGAIAIPRMSSAADNAAKNAVIGNTSVLQRAIDLYTTEHEGVLPDVGAANLRTFYYRLLKTSELDGTVNLAGIYGPYINGIPANTINGKNTIRIDGAVAGANTDGWQYDSISGVIKPDHTNGATGFKAGNVTIEKGTDDLIKSVGG